MTTSSYQQFLATKARRAFDSGHEIDPASIHESLFDFQRAIVCWALKKGRAAVFADTGLGKTRVQLEWARLSSSRALIIAPLSVARQTIREAAKLDLEVSYVRDEASVDRQGLFITNYEMADRFDPSHFDAVVLDESSILKNNLGSTRNLLIRQWKHTPKRLACTATPAPNDVTELTNHAEFLGLMSRAEMLAAYFVHDDDGWRLKGHASNPMYAWMTTWAIAIRRPSDLGYEDHGYLLPPLNIAGEYVEMHEQPPDQLFATELGGVGGRAKVRRATVAARVARACLLAEKPGQWIVWCGLNDESAAVTANIDGAVEVRGTDKPEQKAEVLEAFQDESIRVLVTKPSIAGMGMNFQNCHQMIFLGLSDSWESYYQAIRRCYRFGQTEPVDVHIVVSDLEHQIVENVRQKEVEAGRMTGQLVAHMTRRWETGV